MTARQLVWLVEALVMETHGVEEAEEILAPTPQPGRLRVDPIAVAAMGGVMH